MTGPDGGTGADGPARDGADGPGRTVGGAGAGCPERAGGGRLDLDPETVGRDLAALVLTVVELLRQLMERQAVRRVEQGDLTDAQTERMGTTLMLLDERMDELCARHGLGREELNLDLGPLGSLLPRD